MIGIGWKILKNGEKQSVESEKIVYCLKSSYGFLSDSEWDGDSFTSDPLFAYQYDDVVSGGRGSSIYTCVKIKITTIDHGKHLPSEVIPVICKTKGIRKVRHKCKCSRCGKSTKNLALPETAKERYGDIMNTPCITHKWEYVS